MFAVVTRPGEFGKLLVESPSIYVDDDHILRDAVGVKRWPARIFLGVGTNESGRASCDPSSTTDPELVRSVKQFRQLLLDAGVSPGSIDLTVTPCAAHNEQAWAARLPHALTFLFSRE